MTWSTRTRPRLSWCDRRTVRQISASNVRGIRKSPTKARQFEIPYAIGTLNSTRVHNTQHTKTLLSMLKDLAIRIIPCGKPSFLHAVPLLSASRYAHVCCLMARPPHAECAISQVSDSHSAASPSDIAAAKKDRRETEGRNERRKWEQASQALLGEPSCGSKSGRRGLDLLRHVSIQPRPRACTCSIQSKAPRSHREATESMTMGQEKWNSRAGPLLMRH